jgi:hypothetical protein
MRLSSSPRLVDGKCDCIKLSQTLAYTLSMLKANRFSKIPTNGHIYSVLLQRYIIQIHHTLPRTQKYRNKRLL